MNRKIVRLESNYHVRRHNTNMRIRRLRRLIRRSIINNRNVNNVDIRNIRNVRTFRIARNIRNNRNIRVDIENLNRNNLTNLENETNDLENELNDLSDQINNLNNEINNERNDITNINKLNDIIINNNHKYNDIINNTIHEFQNFIINEIDLNEEFNQKFNDFLINLINNNSRIISDINNLNLSNINELNTDSDFYSNVYKLYSNIFSYKIIDINDQDNINQIDEENKITLNDIIIEINQFKEFRNFINENIKILEYMVKFNTKNDLFIGVFLCYKDTENSIKEIKKLMNTLEKTNDINNISKERIKLYKDRINLYKQRLNILENYKKSFLISLLSRKDLIFRLNELEINIIKNIYNYTYEEFKKKFNQLKDFLTGNKFYEHFKDVI